MRNFNSLYDSELLPALDAEIGAWLGEEPKQVDLSSFPDWLPADIKSFYEIAERWPRANLYGTQDNFVRVGDLNKQDGRYAIVGENQYVWEVALAPEGDGWKLQGGGDLMVGDEFTDDWHDLTVPLPRFLLTYSLQEFICGRPAFDLSPHEHPIWQYLQQDAVPIWTDAVYVWEAPTHSFYSHPLGLLAFVLNGNEAWIGYRDPKLQEHVEQIADE